jgi:diguanylate cyclase (GGDEF)-like protein/PAS domain S-box-containing protein
MSGQRRWGSLDDAATLRDFARHLREAIYVARTTGEVLDANPAFLALAGVATVEEARAHRLDDYFVDPDDRRRFTERLEEEGAVRDVELWMVRPDGDLRAVLHTGFLRRDPATGEAFVHGLLVDITRRRELEATLREQSVRDVLTGLHNRRWLDEQATLLSRQPSASWGCIYLDVDHFKRYNDTHGHKAGDEVLVRMARFLQREVRAEEGVVRIGGDEFVILLAGEDAPATEKVARRLQLAAFNIAPSPFSLGWAMREEQEGLWQTIDRADRDLLEVRVRGRTGGARATDMSHRTDVTDG